MIWSTFEGFVLLVSLKGVFWGNFDHFRLFKIPRIKFSVQRLNTFLEFNNKTFTLFCCILQNVAIHA